MPQYHCNISVVSRSRGTSSVATSAYQARARMRDERTGAVWDYRRCHKHEMLVADLGVALPDGADPAWSDRAVLWSAVETYESAANARVARKIECALPVELNDDERLACARAIVEDYRKDGMCVDAVVHDATDGHNPHLHMQLSVRPCKDGQWSDKSVKHYLMRNKSGDEQWADAAQAKSLSGYAKVYKYTTGDSLTQAQAQTRGLTNADRTSKYPVSRKVEAGWDSPKLAEVWRGRIARRCNEALDRHEQVHGEQVGRVDHRSYARRGLDVVPTKHKGPAMHAMQARLDAEAEEINRELARRKALMDPQRRIPTATMITDDAEATVPVSKLVQPQQPRRIPVATMVPTTPAPVQTQPMPEPVQQPQQAQEVSKLNMILTTQQQPADAVNAKAALTKIRSLIAEIMRTVMARITAEQQRLQNLDHRLATRGTIIRLDRVIAEGRELEAQRARWQAEQQRRMAAANRHRPARGQSAPVIQQPKAPQPPAPAPQPKPSQPMPVASVDTALIADLSQQVRQLEVAAAQAAGARDASSIEMIYDQAIDTESKVYQHYMDALDRGMIDAELRRLTDRAAQVRIDLGSILDDLYEAEANEQVDEPEQQRDTDDDDHDER